MGLIVTGAPLLAVALGGAIGTGARFGLSLLAISMLPEHAYLATLLANGLGAGLIGFLATCRLSPLMRALLMTGFCGGFTTFSLFSLEVLLLAQRDMYLAFGYAGVSVCVWLLAVGLGHRLGQLAGKSR